MVNFIGIHLLNDIMQESSHQNEAKNNPEDQNLMEQGFQPDPATGAHFEYSDLCLRLQTLQKRRAVIDKAIQDEIDLSAKLAKPQ